MKIGMMIMIFMSGFVTALNLTALAHGGPEHYDASWLKVLFALGIGFIAGIFLYKDSNELS